MARVNVGMKFAKPAFLFLAALCSAVPGLTCHRRGGLAPCIVVSSEGAAAAGLCPE